MSEEETPRGMMEQIGSFLKDRDSIRRTVESLFSSVEITKKCQDHLKDLIVDVWTRVGDDVFWVFAYIESIVVLGSNGMTRRENIFLPQPNEKWKDPVQIILSGSLCSEKDDYIRYVIAHEMAHVALAHSFTQSRLVRKHHKEITEESADKLAEIWGFPNPKKDKKKKGG